MIAINQANCRGCGLCVKACPNDAIRLVEGVAQIDQARCDGCKACLSICPNDAIMYTELAIAAPPSQGRSLLAGIGAVAAYTKELLPYLGDALGYFFPRHTETGMSGRGKSQRQRRRMRKGGRRGSQ
ncbi:MAG: 4Fe-4S binding protein [Anaerolineae bacterium]|nr:4Fe-4S binding protein [Anaerolineae bacterium]